MTSLDPIIAVKDIQASTKWYGKIFGFSKRHGGNEFSVLVSADDEVILCLHKWEADHHPTMMDSSIVAGNGLLLYLRTENMGQIYQNVLREECTIEEDIHLNPNSLKREFSFRDPDGYFLTISEFHKYEG